MRSAITVAGMSGHAFSSSCSRGSTASAIEPRGALSYFGGPSEASAPFTVFFDTPSSRAMALMGIFSARCSLRISAQSSTLSTLFLPGSWLEPGCQEGVSFQALPRGQFSRVADNPLATIAARLELLDVSQLRARWGWRLTSGVNDRGA